jgi:hypothetical protein
MSQQFTFSTFAKLPILAKILWNVPKYLPDVPQQQTYNKMVGIYRPDFKVVCSFTHKTNCTESMFHIKSDLIFWCEKYKFEELCIFSNMNMVNNFEITHLLINKNNEEQVFFTKKISDISTQPINMQDIKAQIDEIMNNNKNGCVVS